jgi:hypothetical protein
MYWNIESPLLEGDFARLKRIGIRDSGSHGPYFRPKLLYSSMALSKTYQEHPPVVSRAASEHYQEPKQAFLV